MSYNHVDGNALGGLLFELFGQEMTHQRGCCGKCGNVSSLASALVYRGPSDVLRCPECGHVILVITSMPSGRRITVGSLRWLTVDTPEDP